MDLSQQEPAASRRTAATKGQPPDASVPAVDDRRANAHEWRAGGAVAPISQPPTDGTHEVRAARENRKGASAWASKGHNNALPTRSPDAVATSGSRNAIFSAHQSYMVRVIRAAFNTEAHTDRQSFGNKRLITTCQPYAQRHQRFPAAVETKP